VGDAQTHEIAEAIEALMTWARRRRTISALSATALTTLDRLAYGGPQRVSELAQSEQVTQPGMTSLINRLVEDGLARRADDPSDRRATLVSVTDLGRARVQAHRDGRAAAIEPALAALEPSQRAALAAAVPTLHQLVQGLLADPGTDDVRPAPPRSAPA
jgi:DNA-binding MarR family transcriptional regulator